MSLSVRRVNPATPATAALLTWLQLDTLPADVPLVVDTSASWWLVQDAGQPVAFAALKPSAQFAGVGYLARCGVRQSHRGQGLQRRLLQARERHARQLGWTHLVTDTASGNAASSNNLIRSGYHIYVPSNPWGLEGAIYWIKAL